MMDMSQSATQQLFVKTGDMRLRHCAHPFCHLYCYHPSPHCQNLLLYILGVVWRRAVLAETRTNHFENRGHVGKRTYTALAPLPLH